MDQAHIAIGSGGLWGKGLFNGTQNRLRFLPESRTDFIFSIICEEWGFAGALIILSLYLALFIRFLFVVPTIKSPFVQLLAVGLITPLMVSTVVNICMVIGFLPIVGIPLPLMSYGISSLWITFATLGWFHNIAIRRFYMGEY